MLNPHIVTVVYRYFPPGIASCLIGEDCDIFMYYITCMYCFRFNLSICVFFRLRMCCFQLSLVLVFENFMCTLPIMINLNQ